MSERGRGGKRGGKGGGRGGKRGGRGGRGGNSGGPNICFDHQRGVCTRGESCKVKNEHASLPPPSSPPLSLLAVRLSQFRLQTTNDTGATSIRMYRHDS